MLATLDRSPTATRRAGSTPGPRWPPTWPRAATRRLGAGICRTASWALLAAAEYYAKALVFVDGLADPVRAAADLPPGPRLLGEGRDASAGRFVRVRVPYEGTTLPGYLLRPDATGAPRPTL